jgi:N-acetylneuraminate synthase/N,N'-diacetyllegionaminate synthase
VIVGQRTIAPTERPYVIAELGVNHDGSPAKALALVDAAADAQADAVKVQWFRARSLISADARLAVYQSRAGARDPIEMLHALELDAEALRAVADRAHARGLHAVATVFSIEHVPEASAERFDAFKTASPDLVNQPLLERLIATGKPLFVSTGAATVDEVERTIGWLSDHDYLLMQCVSAYPTPDECASLGGRRAMETLTPNALGYSDHTTAVDTGGLAVAAGACCLEKHLTLDAGDAGPDHAISLEPDALGEYVRLARRAHAMLGGCVKRVHEIERDVREASRQSIVARRSRAKGDILQPDDLTIKRPGTGLEPWRLRETVGRRLARALEADRPLHEDDLA